MTEKNKQAGDPASDKLRELRRQRQILDSLNEAVITSDLDGVITEWSKGAERLWGYSASEVIGKHHDILLNPAQNHTPEESILQNLTQEGSYEDEQKLLTKSGDAFIGHLSMSLLMNDEGRSEGFIALITDITAQQRIERDLQKSEERFRRVFEDGPLGMTLVTEGGKFIAANDRFCEITGYSEKELIGRSSIEITHPDDVDADLTFITEASAGFASTQTVEKRYIKKSGETVWVRVTRGFLKGDDNNGSEDNNPSYGMGMVEDITESKQTEERLRQAQKMEAVGQLTGGIAHDFNNLLAVIRINVEIARERLGENERVQPLLDMIFQAGESAADLTQRLLAFSRQQILSPAAIDLNEVLEDTAGLLERTLGEHIEITSTLGDDLWRCLADRSQIENTILNLALNARDAMPEGGRLDLETANASLTDEYAAAQAEVKPGKYVMLAITDTGEGIPPENQKHIFEPFFTTKKVGEGTGLGLSMVYGFVKQSGGHMTVYSEVGEGTTFKIYLPRTEKALVEQTPSGAAEDEHAALEATILVVEDDPNLRTLAVALLSDKGYQVLEAGSGPAALELLGQDHHIDLLLTDVVMPGGMTGPALATKVRRDRPGTRVLFMSGYAAQAMADTNRLGGTEVFLQKPFGKKDLLDKVREVLTTPVD